MNSMTTLLMLAPNKAPEAVSRFEPEQKLVIQQCLCCYERGVTLMFSSLYFGWQSTCLRCGNEWTDGWFVPDNLTASQRLANADNARKRWRDNIANKHLQ